MKKLFISAGHTNVQGKDRGASGNGYIEGVETVRVRDKIVKEYRNLGGDVTIDNNSNALIHTINYFKNMVNQDCILFDIHFNSAGPTITGVETFIPSINSNFEKKLAKSISNTTSETLNIPLRGNYDGLKGVRTESESHHGKLGWMRLSGENVLWEICFISNKNDMKKYEDNIDILCRNIAHTLYRFATSLTNVLPSNTYIVKKGDTVSKIAATYNITVNDIISLNNIDPNKIKVGQVLRIK